LRWIPVHEVAFNPRSIPLNPCVNDLSLTHNGLPFELVVVVAIELRQRGNFLPLAMVDVLSWNQMDHDKSLLVSLASMSVTLPHLPFSISLHEILTCASPSHDSFYVPSQRDV
jgi:hypothetical protein